MKLLKSLLLPLMFLLLATTCEKTIVEPLCTGDCDQAVIVDPEAYKTAPRDNLVINSMEIIDDCLHINFSSGGCDGSRWEVQLIDAGEIMESYPPRRNVILSLKNDEECDAWITKDISFYIKDLRVEGSPVILIIRNNGEELRYE